MAFIEKIQNIGILKEKQISCVSIRILSNNQIKYSAIELRKNKETVEISKQFKTTDNLENLLKNISPKAPIIIDVDGKGVLSKRIISVDQKEDIVSKVLPNSQSNDFFYSQICIYQKTSFVTIIRKEIIERIITLFNMRNQLIIGLVIGPFKINSILSLLNNSDDILCNNKVFKHNGEHILDFSNQEEERQEPIQYRIGDDLLSQENLVAFASGISFFAGDEAGFCQTEFIKTYKREATYKNLFVLTGWGVLFLFFVLLLVNFLFFDSYSKSNDVLATKIETNKSLLTQMDILESEIKLKEDFLSHNNFLKPIRYSYFSDRVAALTKEGIVLTEFNINPLQKKLKQNISPNFSENVILITGFSAKSHILNQYVKDLKNESWIKNVEVTRYEKKNNYKSGEFELSIKF